MSQVAGVLYSLSPLRHCADDGDSEGTSVARKAYRCGHGAAGQRREERLRWRKEGRGKHKGGGGT